MRRTLTRTLTGGKTRDNKKAEPKGGELKKQQALRRGGVPTVLLLLSLFLQTQPLRLIPSAALEHQLPCPHLLWIPRTSILAFLLSHELRWTLPAQQAKPVRKPGELPADLLHFLCSPRPNSSGSFLALQHQQLQPTVLLPTSPVAPNDCPHPTSLFRLLLYPSLNSSRCHLSNTVHAGQKTR